MNATELSSFGTNRNTVSVWGNGSTATEIIRKSRVIWISLRYRTDYEISSSSGSTVVAQDPQNINHRGFCYRKLEDFDNPIADYTMCIQ